MGEPTEPEPIDFLFDDNQDTGEEVDAATDVAAASVAFNNAALPPNLPEWLKDTIRAKAVVILQAMQDDKMRLTALRASDEEAQDTQISMWQAVAARERCEREWDQSRVTVGSVAMSGAEWDAAYELLSDPKMREQLIDSMVRKRGWSNDRAEKAADDALTLAQIAQKKKDGTITPADEAKATEITQRNPDAVEMVKEAAQKKSERGYGGLSGFPCAGGHNGYEEFPLCHDAKNRRYRTSCSTSCWRAEPPALPLSKAACWIP